MMDPFARQISDPRASRAARDSSGPDEIGAINASYIRMDRRSSHQVTTLNNNNGKNVAEQLVFHSSKSKRLSGRSPKMDAFSGLRSLDHPVSNLQSPHSISAFAPASSNCFLAS